MSPQICINVGHLDEFACEIGAGQNCSIIVSGNIVPLYEVKFGSSCVHKSQYTEY